MKLDKEIREKRPELATRKASSFIKITPDHIHFWSLATNYLLELGWKVMPHPRYSPDLAPSDYHVFRSLQNLLNEKTFDSNEAVKNELI